jgi:ankyrin repeat protein
MSGGTALRWRALYCILNLKFFNDAYIISGYLMNFNGILLTLLMLCLAAPLFPQQDPYAGLSRADRDLIVASGGTDIEKVKTALVDGANVNACSLWGTPLSAAASAGNLGTVKLLLKSGAEVDRTCSSYMPFTPLMGAINRKKTDAALLLIEAGADVNFFNDYSNPLWLAITMNDLVLAGKLIELKARMVPPPKETRPLLRLAIKTGNPEMVKTVIGAGSPVNQVYFDHYHGTTTHLIVCAKENRLAMARILLDHGATPDIPGVHRRRALAYAAREGHAGMVKLLLRHGANKRARDAKNRTALDYARMNRHGDIVRLLK